MRPVTLIAFGLILTGILTAPLAAQTLKLRAKVNATGDVVMFEDFFKGTGASGSTALFRAPRSGRTGAVRVGRLVTAVERLGYSWVPPSGLRSIRVSRKTATIEVDEIAALIRQELAGAIPDTENADDLDITLPVSLRTIRIADTPEAGMIINQLDLTPRTRSFRAAMTFGIGENQIQRTIEGRYAVRRRVPVPVVNIARNQIITFENITWVRLADNAIGAAITQAEDIIGKSARRGLAVGRPVLAIDLEAPRIVFRNQLVTVMYSIPGMKLTARGRALRDAAAGETVPVLNLSSNRTIVATAIGPGQVSVTNASEGLQVASVK
ncbi:MAG: flagellar basal body P-ring formation chaperone FlgA [Hyphomicrobiales bacterium]